MSLKSLKQELQVLGHTDLADAVEIISQYQQYRKIDIFVDGKYVCSTTRAKNLKEAKENFIKDPSWQGLTKPSKLGKNILENIKDHKVTVSYASVKASSEKQVEDYEIVDHGVENEQYFQGCGTSGTKYDDVFTGIGNSAYEALDDALDQAAQSDWNIDSIKNEESKNKDVEDGDGYPDGLWHYVSIRLKASEAKAESKFITYRDIHFTADDHNKLTFAFESVKNGNERELKNGSGKIVAIYYPKKEILKITNDRGIIEWLKDNSFIN